MALGARQRRLYKSKVALYKPVLTRDAATGLLTDKEYVLAGTAVKCLFEKRDSVSTPFVIGRGEQDNQFTHEEIHFQANQVIGENWVILDQTVDVHGVDALTNGDYWIVIGEPKKIPDLGGRRAGHVSVQANRHKTPHPSIS